MEHHLSWLGAKLPRAEPLASIDATSFGGPGAYVLEGEGTTLYVGETRNVGERIEQFRRDGYWGESEVTVRVVPVEEKMLPGMQSILVGRLSPLLNAPILKPTLPATVAT